MLHAAVVLFVLAIIAASLGFVGIAASAAWLAKIFALVFLAMAICGFVLGRRRIV